MWVSGRARGTTCKSQQAEVMENAAVRCGWSAGCPSGVRVGGGVEWKCAVRKMRLMLKGLLSHAKESGLHSEGPLEVTEAIVLRSDMLRAEFMRRLGGTVQAESRMPV